MNNVFSDLLNEPGQPQPPTDTQKAAQPGKGVSKRSSTNLSRPASKKVSKPVNGQPTTERVEELAFRLRRQAKIRINADVPEAWKKRLDDLAYELQVGKYELVMYVIKRFLDEIDAAQQDAARRDAAQ